jgi:predicted DNA-binding transcriptional regulator AlpA
MTSTDKLIATAAAAAPPAAPPVRLIDKRELLKKVPVSYPHIWALMRDGKFPKSRIVGNRAVWLESDVDRWIAALPEQTFKGQVEVA